MSRAAIAPLVAAAMALSCLAGAADAVRPSPVVEIKLLGVAGGASFATSQRAISTELVRADWPTLPAITPAFHIGFGLALYDWSIDFHIHGSDVTLSDDAGSARELGYHRATLGAEAGYRLWLGRALTLSPHVGLAMLRSTLCFAGNPDSAASIARPPFEQILANPGRSTCLDASALGADVGLSSAWNFHISFDKTGQDPLGLYLSVGPRLGYTLPLSSSRTWDDKTSGRRTENSPFQGPLAPLGEAYAGVEVQVRFAVDTWAPGSKRARSGTP